MSDDLWTESGRFIWPEGDHVCCRFCRKTEHNDWLLTNNHTAYWHLGECVAQHLTKNQCHFMVGMLDPTSGISIRHRGRKFDLAEAVRQADERLTYAAELWAHHPANGWVADLRAVVDQAKRVLAPSMPTGAPPSEESSLW